MTHVHSSLENDAPLVKISVDPVKASAEGLAPAQVAGQVYAMLSGTEATTLNVNGNDLSVKVEYGDCLLYTSWSQSPSRMRSAL